jgi:quinol monooxygenase YgiN
MDTYYGMHNQFTAHSGQGEALIELLLEAAEGLRANNACLVYIVSGSPEDPNVVWVTEAWTDRAAHRASLQDKSVQAAIQRARPLITAISTSEFQPIGGKGI